tara:strand:- start:537 stop:677 length:141 start_codon:yes stop_codon:yes gene_type:complete
MNNNNKAYWEALIRGLAWPNQKRKSNAGWYAIAGVAGGFLLLFSFM